MAIAVIVTVAFVKSCPWKGVVAVAGLPINPLAVYWNVDVSVCPIQGTEPSAEM